MDKRIKKGSAVLTAWTLIAIMGISPAGVAFPSYAAIAERTDQEIKAASSSEAGRTYDVTEEQIGENPELTDTELRTNPETADTEVNENSEVTDTASETATDSEKEEEELEQDRSEADIPEAEEEKDREEMPEERITATPSEAVPEKEQAPELEEIVEATPSNALLMAGDLWGGIEMSDHFDGEGTVESPYLLRNDKDLKLLAYQVANEEVDGYKGCYFELTKDISLNDSASWLPIGYYRSLTDSEPYPFKGNIEGNGYRVYNLKISDTSQNYAGLFGYTYGASIRNLTVDGQVNAANKAALIVGEANDTVIEKCFSLGQVRAAGVLGGIVGEAYDSMISDCKNTGSVLGGTDISGSLEAYAGGICGSAHSTFIGDCVSDTNDSYSSLYSEGCVGGICGNIYDSEVYNCYVEGKVGSTSADYIGGLVGRMQSGRVKNGRFAGTIGASTSSALKTAGLFIGFIEGGNIELGDHLEYLFANSEDKFALNPFGNKLTPQIRLEHHIGAYYSNNRDFSLYQMGSFVKQTSRFFYEELEEGVLAIGDSNIHHIAASKTGDPIRGYLVTVPSVDYGTLSVMESQNNYVKEINWANPGAVAAGTKVLVYTSPVNNTESNPPVYYELEPGSLTWVSDDGGHHEEINTDTTDISFTMPDENITVSAKYRAMTNGVVLDRDKLNFEVEQIRSGSRWNPQIAWKITDPQHLTATVIPDSAANKNVVWNVKDTDGSSTDVISVDDKGAVTVNQDAKWIQDLIKAGVTNQELYPSKPITTEGKNYASVTVTTEAGQKRASCLVTVDFKITDETTVPVSNITLNQSEISFDVVRVLSGNRLQPEVAYRVTPSQRLYETITPEYADNKAVTWKAGDGDMVTVDRDGLVSVNNQARWIADLINVDNENLKLNPYDASIASGNRSTYITATTVDGGKQAVCAVNIDFSTEDHTVVHVEGVQLEKKNLTFSIEKIMEGNRLNPSVRYEVTPAQKLNAVIVPDQADNKKITWETNDGSVLTVDQGGSVEVNQDAAWIQALIANDEARLKENKYALSNASGSKKGFVVVTAEDGQYKDTCEADITFTTTDLTIVHPEEVKLSKEELVFDIELVKEGRRSNPTLTWNITSPQQLSASVLPEAAHNRNYTWSVSDQNMINVEDGMVTANHEAKWIQDLNGAAGSAEAAVTVTAEDGGIEKSCKVILRYKTTDRTYSSSGSGSSGGGGGGFSSSVRPNTVTETGPAGTWLQDQTGWWFKYTDGSYPKDTWVQLGYNGKLEWYHFDEAGYMQTGWFTDKDQNRYFLHNVSDGTQGHMVTGWYLVEGKWYYFNPVSDGTRGALFVNRTTPDGYTVGADGVWLP